MAVLSITLPTKSSNADAASLCLKTNWLQTCLHKQEIRVKINTWKITTQVLLICASLSIAQVKGVTTIKYSPDGTNAIDSGFRTTTDLILHKRWATNAKILPATENQLQAMSFKVKANFAAEMRRIDKVDYIGLFIEYSNEPGVTNSTFVFIDNRPYILMMERQSDTIDYRFGRPRIGIGSNLRFGTDWTPLAGNEYRNGSVAIDSLQFVFAKSTERRNQGKIECYNGREWSANCGLVQKP